MKTLLLTLLLSTTACQLAAVPIIYKGSQIANSSTNGKTTETLTHNDGEACKKGDEAACHRCAAYSIAFIGSDQIAALAVGRPDLLVAGHCETWAAVDEALPTISKEQANYGKKNYNQFIGKRR